MRTKLTRKLLSAVCALALLLSLAPAARAADGPASTSNAGANNYGRWSTPVKSYLFENDQGGLTRVEYANGSIIVEDYSSSFQFQSSRTIPMELPLWGGFYAGEDYNFFFFGQENASQNDRAEVVRAVKYSKDWKRLDQGSLYGANTVDPFSFGSLRCTEKSGTLYVRTCHRMYAASDGLNHQSNMTFSVNESTMELFDACYTMDMKFKSDTYGYTSHSFNQFILIDQSGRQVSVDHGDAYPREIVLHASGKDYTLLKFPGSIGDNNTGASVGGFAETSNHYVTAYNYGGSTTAANGSRTVYLAFTSKSGMKTSTVSVGSNAYTPVLAPTGLNGGYVMWINSDNKFCCASYSDSGTVGSVQTLDGMISDCQPISYNGKAVWYATKDSTPYFYTLDASGLNIYPTSGPSVSTPSSSTSGAAPSTTTPTNPGATPTTPSKSFTDVSASHWAKEWIDRCVGLNVVQGYPTGAFGPDDPVTGAQFAVMLSRLFFSSQLEANSANSSGSWYLPALTTVSNAGVLAGTSRLAGGAGSGWSGVADQNLNRYDMAQMIYNTAAALGKAPDAAARAQAGATVSDFSRIPSGYQTAVSGCIALGAIRGMDNGTFSGNNNMTRAQACTAICRALDAVGTGGTSGQTGQTAASISISPDALELEAGKTGSVRATLTGGSASIAYTSSDPSVAMVSTSGAVTAVKAGTAVITASATVNGQTLQDTCAVTVKGVNASITMTPRTLELEVGKTGSVKAVLSDSSAHLTYTSSNPDVAMVDFSGTVITVKAGTAVITATATLNGQTLQDTCTVTVKGVNASITMTPRTLELEVGKTGSVRAVLSDSSAHLTYTSSNPDVAMVDFSGTVITVKAGTAVITASATVNGQTVTAQCTVTVKESASVSSGDFCDEVVRLVNAERAKEGLDPLGTFDTLTKAADIRAPELITRFEHTRPDGSTCFTALGEAGVSGYYTAGENIAAGQATPAAVVESWMNSTGHRANILNKDFTHIGVGYVKGSGGYGHYWVQMFIGTRSAPSGGSSNGSSTPSGGSASNAALTMSVKTLELDAGQTGSARASISGTSTAAAITYTSSNQSVASVNWSTGEITAKSAGTAVITARATVNGQTLQDTCTVTVKDLNVAVTMDAHTLDLEVDKTGTVSASVSGVTPAPSITYSSSDQRVATVDRISGVVTARNTGTATITASVTVNGRTYKDTCTVSVKLGPITVTLTPYTLTLEAGKSSTVKPVYGNLRTSYGPKATYTSSDPSVASVSASGQVTGVSAGTAVITVYAEYLGTVYTDDCEVTVTAKETPAPSGSSTAPDSSGGYTPSGSTGYRNNRMTASEVPASGRVTSYSETWDNGNFRKIEVSGSTITFSGCRDDLPSLYNYVVITGFGSKLDYTPFVSGEEFSVSIDIDIAGLNSLYGGDTSRATSYITGGFCQNYTPGSHNTAGVPFFQNYTSIRLALSGDGGLELQLSR